MRLVINGDHVKFLKDNTEIANIPASAITDISYEGKVSWWQPKNRRIPLIDLSLQKRIEHAVSWVLNPLSHSQSVDRYRIEIQDAIYIIDDLQTAVERAKRRPSIRPTIGIEEIISVLKAYIARMKQREEGVAVVKRGAV